MPRRSLPLFQTLSLSLSTTQRLTLWRLFRQRPGCIAEVIRCGQPLPPNVHSTGYWMNGVAKLRLTQEQEELLDNLQARILPQLDLVRRLGQLVLPGVEGGA